MVSLWSSMQFLKDSQDCTQKPLCNWLLTPTHGSLECIFCTILSPCMCASPTTKQQNSLWAQGPGYCKFVGGLEIFLDCKEVFFCLSFSAFVLPSWTSRSGSNCFLTSTTAPNAFPTSCMVLFYSERCLTAMMWTKYSSCSLGQRQTSENLSHWATWPWFAWCLSSHVGQ